MVELQQAKHVAFIMDGNGRWAKKRLMPRLMGHRAGVSVVKHILRAAPNLGVEAVTLWAFSIDNWQRPLTEVNHLMSLFGSSLQKNIDELDQEGVRLRFIGDLSVLNDKLVTQINAAHRQTEDNTRLQLNIAVNYKGTWDITQAMQTLGQQIVAGELAPADIDENLITNQLSAAGMPKLDLVVRTGGESRVSNFMMWQLAYSELFFTETLWPDFSVSEFKSILKSFSLRERRFGKTSAQLEQLHA